MSTAESDRFRLDLGGLEFCEPVGLACLAAGIHYLQLREQTCVEVIRPSSADVSGYLERLGLFEMLGVKDLYPYQRRSPDALLRHGDPSGTGEEAWGTAPRRHRPQGDDVLKTRFMGARFRDEIRALLDRREEVRVDFTGVGAISHSFADECFGDLFSEFGADLFRERVHLAAANEGVRAVLRLVFADRRSKEAA